MAVVAVVAVVTIVTVVTVATVVSPVALVAVVLFMVSQYRSPASTSQEHLLQYHLGMWNLQGW